MKASWSDLKKPCHEYGLELLTLEKRKLRIAMIGRGIHQSYGKGDVSFLDEQCDSRCLYGLEQVHGDTVYKVESFPDSASGLCLLSTADALMIDYETLGSKILAVKTADCAPIVLLGTKELVLIHAGWKGLAAGIIQKACKQLSSCYQAFIFPSARACCYEIGQEVHRAIGATAVIENRNDSLFLDVSATARQQLMSILDSNLIAMSSICTICDERLHSYRRERERCGHNYTYVRLIGGE